MRPTAPLLRSLLALVLLAAAAGAQDTTATSTANGDPRDAGQKAQQRFETYRRANLPMNRGSSVNACQERVGRFCYWYDDVSPPPAPEQQSVTDARNALIVVLDSLARSLPTDEWLAGQRIRYLDEAGRHAEALAAARQCRSFGWWCPALEGFALHQLGRYVEAEAMWDTTMSKMAPSLRCIWTDISWYLDEDTRRQYSRNVCGTPQRAAYESRIWWLARTRYGMAGNDSRSEHFARHTYAEFLRAAPSAHMFGFDDDEHELLIRFGWPRAWSIGDMIPAGPGRPAQINVIGHDPTPAYRFIPPNYVITSPVMSDSTDWAVQLPPVVARYQPPYAKHLFMLEHQQGLFRRGDTALVVVAYDVTRVDGIAGSPLEAALVATPVGAPQQLQTVIAGAPARGTMTVRAPWGPLLMSAELAAPEASSLVRARYGIRPPLATGTRVSLSDLLFYAPYGDIPTTVEEVLPHVLPTQRMNGAKKVGVFWEAYGTDPNGEQMTITLTVSVETEQMGVLRRSARRMRLSRPPDPVSVTVQDLSAPGSSRSPRALEVDISTLTAGDYIVQLEVSVAGQYTIRTDRRIVVTGS